MAGTRTVLPRAPRTGPGRPGVPGQLPGRAPGSDDAVFLISELATNACTHSASGSPGGRLTIRAEFCPALGIYAEVEDQGGDWDGTVGSAIPPHGLYLLRELAATCGTRRGEHGWITWFTITSPSATPHEPKR